MGVPLNHPFINGFSMKKKHSFWGTAIYGNRHLYIWVNYNISLT
jgi:hypothetical protein